MPWIRHLSDCHVRVSLVVSWHPLDRGTGRDRAGQCHGFSRTADISARHFRSGMSECAGLSRSSTSQRRRVLWLTPIMSAAAAWVSPRSFDQGSEVGWGVAGFWKNIMRKINHIF